MTDLVPVFTPATAPVTAPMTNAQRQARHRVTDKGIASNRRANASWQRRKDGPRYLARPFVAWDGEGVTRANGQHDYVLFASSRGDRIQTLHDSLTFADIAESLLVAKDRDPDAIHVIYGGGYDFNMWLKGCDRDTLALIYRSTKPVRFGDYAVRWRPGKNMHIRDLNNRKRSVTVYDVVSFFQTTFVSACDEYLFPLLDWHERAMIMTNKRLRGSFTVEQLDDIVRYNDAELVNIVDLMTELRDRLARADLRLSRWDGPGAIAAVLLQRQNIKAHMQSNVPPDVSKAGRHAYFGGRFEVVLHGRSPKGVTIYQYDINSAYPSAMRSLPSLASGTWRHHTCTCGEVWKGSKLEVGNPHAISCPFHTVAPFALYRVRWSARENMRNHLGPFPYRTDAGRIYYPMAGEGWYWSPEVAEGLKHPSCDVTVLEAWVWEPDTDYKPFAFVEGLYNKRRALKKAGDGAEKGLKLALNSLYGKLAQQVGWGFNTKGELRVPPFHQLEWAGYVTSHCRAQIMHAARQAPEHVIAVETDAIFTTKRLRLPIGSGLGQWSETIYRDITYCQSGVYFCTLEDGTVIKNKTRGVDLGTVSREDIWRAMRKLKPENRTVPVPMHRFHGAGIALQQDFDSWCTWDPDGTTKNLTVEPQGGKRIHGALHAPLYCPCDPKKSLLAHKGWHLAMCPLQDGGDVMSAEHRVVWINPHATPDQDYIDELRELQHERDYG